MGAMLGFACGCASEARRTAPEKITREYAVSEVGPEAFVSGTSREALENSEPKSQGGEILQAQVLFNDTASHTVASLGIPDAVEELIGTAGAANTSTFILFYRHPARTILIDNSGGNLWSDEVRGAVIRDLPIVPGYARVFGFNEVVAGAWPVTISSADALYFSVPEVPQPPPPEIAEGSDYAPVAQQILSGITLVSQGPDYERAQRAFARLVEVASTRGLNWKLYVYEATYDDGYGVPDGSIFVSTSLIEHLGSDDELTAVVAHLMAHERYGHSRNAITRANKFALEAGAASPFVALLSLGYAGFQAVVLAGMAISTPFMSYPKKLSFYGYEDSEELEADVDFEAFADSTTASADRGALVVLTDVYGSEEDLNAELLEYLVEQSFFKSTGE
jgi:hypothetical protein